MRETNNSNHLFLPTAIILSVIGFFSGCSGGVQTADAVNVDVASETLSKVLDAWKSGAKVADLRSQIPEIVVQDFDWSQNKKLKQYESVGSPVTVDANLQATVRLFLEDQAGRSENKEVTYIVGTDPVLTVFRKAF
jgi:hypothetical protein